MAAAVTVDQSKSPDDFIVLLGEPDAVSVGLEAGFTLVEAHPFLAVAAGSIAGMFFNFAASKHLVFKGA